MTGSALRLIVGAAWLAVGAYAALHQWAQANSDIAPRTALSVAPGNVQALLAVAETQRREEKGTSSPGFRMLNARLLREGPLLDAPLVYAGLAAGADGDIAGARAAFDVALVRSPRNRLVRTWLARQAMAEGAYEEAVRQIDRLMIIDDSQEDLHIDMLIDISSKPEGLAAVEAALAEKPVWVRAFVRRLNETSNDFEALVGINALAPDQQEQFLRRTIEEQGIEAAYRSWVRFLSESDRRDLSWPYNKQFARLSAAAPFNWAYASDHVEATGRDGVDVVYLGRDAPVFVEQVMLLRPGFYRFEARMEGDTQPDGGAFTWGVRCAGAEAELGRVEAKPLGEAVSAFAFEFEVPASACAAQTLRLRGLPGELLLRAHSLTRSVSILATDAAE